MQKLCVALKTRRKELRITLKELSAKIGISAVSLNKYEKDIRLPNVNNLNKITEALGLDYDEMFEILAQEKAKRKEFKQGN